MLNIIKFFVDKKNQKLNRNIEQIEFDDLNKNKQCIIIDVRSKQEYLEGHLNGAINIPLNKIKEQIEFKIPNKQQDIILYCQAGVRSMKAANIIEKLGYTNIKNLKGGLNNK